MTLSLEQIRNRVCSPSNVMGYAIYHASDWAEARTDAEIIDEIKRTEEGALNHTYQWNEVGSAGAAYARADALRVILADRRTTTNPNR